MLGLQKAVNAGARYKVRGQEIWLLAGLAAEGAQFDIVRECLAETSSTSLSAQWRGLLLFDRVEIHMLEGSVSFWPVRFERLAKLLAFVDEARGIEPLSNGSCWGKVRLEQLDFWREGRKCEYWFLTQALEPNSVLEDVFSLLRRCESYWLARFLLRQSVEGARLEGLGPLYGVSRSHFRRLCHRALGNSAKAELRGWRMARCLLDLVENRKNLTEVALEHGYASSSHFSNEVRELVGVSPTRLTKGLF